MTPWTAKMTNEKVMEKAGTRALMKTLTVRQMDFFGHVMRKGDLEYLAFTAKIEGRRARGKQRMTYADSLSTRVGVQPMDLIRATATREIWRNMAANVSI